MKNYIISKEKEALIRACLKNKPIAGAFLFGPAGTGKTYLAECLAEEENAEKFFFQCFPGTREEDLLVKILPSDKTKSGVKTHDGVIIEACKSLKKGNPTYLILDEWDKTRPSADSFLLDFLQSGRVNYNSKSFKLAEKELELLRVFITMNDERELSEPLLRRLPVIKFSPLSPSLVRQALNLTHNTHPYLTNAVILYEKCLVAGMSKPATIQELRQLLDAITFLGDKADWNSLVYQFITKTDENHHLLKAVEDLHARTYTCEEAILDEEKFEEEKFEEEIEEEIIKPKMPQLKSILKIDETKDSIQATEEEFSNLLSCEDTKGIIELDDDSYNSVVKLIDNLNKHNLDKLSMIFKIVNDNIILKKSLTLRYLFAHRHILSNKGEILVEEKFNKKQILSLQRRYDWKIIKLSENEILAKKDKNLELRWTKEKTDIIVKIPIMFADFFNSFGIDPKNDNYVCNLINPQMQTKSTKSIQPIQPIIKDKSELDKFNAISNYIMDLYRYSFSEKEYHSIYVKPAKYDLAEWEIKLKNLEKTLYFFREVEKYQQYCHLNYWGSNYGLSQNISLENNKDCLEIKIRAIRYNEGEEFYNVKNFEDIIERIKREIERTENHIKSITEVK